MNQQRKPKEGYKLIRFLFNKYEEIPNKWEITKLIEVCKQKPQYGAAVAALPKNELLPRYIRITDIKDDGTLGDDWVSINEQEAKPYILSQGDILFARTGATVGKTYLYREKDGRCAFAGYLIRFKPDYHKLDAKFLFHYTHSHNYWRWLNSFFTHGVQPNVNAEQYSNLMIIRPPIQEQIRITSILSEVDYLIQKTDKIIEQTQRLKKGLMQRLLIDGIGHIKFKEATLGLRFLRIKIPHEWDVVRVKDITQSIVPGRNKPTRFDGDIPWITIADIDSMYTSKSKAGLNITRDEIKRTANKVVPPRSVIMSCVGEFGIVTINTKEVVLNQQLHAFICSDKILPYFLAISLAFWKKYMYSIATTTTIAYLNKDNCESIPVVLPPIREQEKIIAILSVIDSRIQKEDEYRDRLLKLKNSLMQILLTGKIRVKV